eukprot:5111573-Amphidinium_carterae.1
MAVKDEGPNGVASQANNFNLLPAIKSYHTCSVMAKSILVGGYPAGLDISLFQVSLHPPDSLAGVVNCANEPSARCQTC